MSRPCPFIVCLLLLPFLLGGCHHWWEEDCNVYCYSCGEWYCDGSCANAVVVPWIIIANSGGGTAGWPPPSTPLLEQFWYTSFDTAGGTDEDWFRLEVDDAYVHILVDFIDAGGDVDVTLYDDQGNLLAVADSATDNETLVYGPVPPGIYYAVVYGYGIWVGPNPYDIWWDDRLGAAPLRSLAAPIINN